MATCFQSITPNIIEDPCQGKHISTDCVIFNNSITYLSLPTNSTETEVIQALLLSLIDARTRIISLEEVTADQEIRITALENA